ITPAHAGHGPTLTWPARPREIYEVQSKNTLSDPQWQPVSGTIIITGNQAQLTEFMPPPGQRFYRVIALQCKQHRNTCPAQEPAGDEVPTLTVWQSRRKSQ